MTPGSFQLSEEGKNVYQGKALSVLLHPSLESLELVFDLQGEAVNKFNALTLKELSEAATAIEKEVAQKGSQIKVLIYTSRKDSFIVGADITEFLQHFKKSEEELKAWLLATNAVFSRFEDLPIATLCALDGFSLGGGFEFALTAAYRVATKKSAVGLPETKLGLYPGWGGTVRLSRLCGADTALEWIGLGQQFSAEDALKVGAVDGVCESKDLKAVVLSMLQQLKTGQLDWKARQNMKKSPLKLNPTESGMVFGGAKAYITSMTGGNYPAPLAALEAMEKGSRLTRDEALPWEAAGFAKVARTSVARSLVGIFLGDQFLKKKAKSAASLSAPIQTVSVLGAGIMGGGICYQAASRGLSVVMKDIRPEALDLGMGEAAKLLEKQVERKKITPAQMAMTLSKITKTLDPAPVAASQIVIEAVVESLEVKKKVLQDTESLLASGSLLTSNTSTLSIDLLATALKRPEDFCGMHFFNPVPKMPLVEVVRGSKTSEKTIATVVQLASRMGKTPIVVRDCAGFLVNRILFPYFVGFLKAVEKGIPFQVIDKTMESFGWPMGPAYLLDVIGIDTAYHAYQVVAKAFPDRIDKQAGDLLGQMHERKWWGQKNQKGFYVYQNDARGKPKKELSAEAMDLFYKGKPLVTEEKSAIVDRLMIPMIFESARCLEENIVDTPTELDMALVYGLGFPPFRGGACMYADTLGIKNVNAAARKYESEGGAYKVPSSMKTMEEQGRGFYEV